MLREEVIREVVLREVVLPRDLAGTTGVLVTPANISLLPLLSSPSSEMSEYAGEEAGGFSWLAGGDTQGTGLLTALLLPLSMVTTAGSSTLLLAMRPAGSWPGSLGAAAGVLVAGGREEKLWG